MKRRGIFMGCGRGFGGFCGGADLVVFGLLSLL